MIGSSVVCVLVVVAVLLPGVDLQQTFDLKQPDRNTGVAVSKPELENLLQEAKNKRQGLQAKVKTLQDQATNLLNTAQTLTNTTKFLADQAASQAPFPLAFEATLTDDITNNFMMSRTVVFDNVLTNVGFEYDTNTGFFHCKRSGIYLFAITLYADGSNGDASLDVYLNHVVVARPLTGRAAGVVGSSGVAIGKARVGDEMRVQLGILPNTILKNTRFSAIFLRELDW